MKTTAGVIAGPERDWEIVELDLEPPRHGEVLVKWMASGICHTDEHIRQGDFVPYLPVVAGHEGAGIVEAVGPGVDSLEVGDHVVGSWIACCGRCRWCGSGRSNLCDNGARMIGGALADDTYRFFDGTTPFGQFAGLGTFSERSVVDQLSAIRIDPSIPFDVASLVGCGVPTGWGSSVNVAAVEPGETVVIYGIGGIGANAVQGAAMAGALNIIAVDLVPGKLKVAETFGATHVANSAAEAVPIIQELTRGVGADKTIMTAGIVTDELVAAALDATRKGGTAVLTGSSNTEARNISYTGQSFYCNNQTLKGHLYGECNPRQDIPRLLGLYQSGALLLDELITNRYSLRDLSRGVDAMLNGDNVRGVIMFDD